MPATARGIYHNLKESEYVASNGEVTFFFSSKLYRDKFLTGYEDHRGKFWDKIEQVASETPLNMETLADIAFYDKVEKRGYYAQLKGGSITWHELHAYALRKMTEKNTPDWSKTQKPKLDERLKIMGLTYHQK